jgi:large repetitive protein
LLFRKDIVTTFSGETVRKFRVLLLVGLGILVWVVVFAGCSGSNSLTVTLAPASGLSLNPGQTATITATVANDSTNGGVNWTLSGPGTLSGNTTTTVVYTAPATLSVTSTATITATSVANSTITAIESITVNAVLTITTTSLPSGTLNVPYNSFVNAAGAPVPFTWSVISGSLPAGLTFLTTSTSSSAEITGTPTLLGTSKFSVQVTDSSGASVTQALSITINTPPPLSVATASLPVGTVNMQYPTTPLQANSGVPPYTWSLIDGTTLPLGLSLASTGVISGTPFVSGTFNFTVQVTDSSTPSPQTASAILGITINPGTTTNGLLSGNYAFSVRGFDPSGLFVAAGSFAADGQGDISGGIMDINDTTGSFPVNQTFSGTYFIGTNGLGSMTFKIDQPGSGSRTFALSMTAGGNANIIEFDDSTGGGTRNSGVLLQQTISSPTGSYAFGFAGIDPSKNRFGEAGQFAIGSNGAISGSLDSDDASSGTASNVSFSGKYSVASNGRGTITIGADSYVFYVVDATQLFAVEIDPFPPGLHPLVSGTILQQSNNGSFTVANLNGPAVFEVTALDPTGPTSQSQVGVFGASGGNGQFNLTSDENNGGALTAPCSGTLTQCAPGTDTVATNGRVTLTDSGFQNSSPPQTLQPVLYLVSNNQAFIIGTDPAVSFGFMTAQSGSPFIPTSLSGTYAGGSLAPVDSSVSNVVSIAVAGSSNLTVTQDVSNNTGLSQVQAAGTTSLTDVSTGRFTAALGNTSEILYLVSTGQYFALSTDNTARVDIFGQ